MNLSALRCSSCGAFWSPGRKVCGRCLSSDLKTCEVEGRGSIVSFTVIASPRPGFGEGPYAYVLVELQCGLMVSGHLAGCTDGASLHPGLRVILEGIAEGRNEFVLSASD